MTTGCADLVGPSTRSSAALQVNHRADLVNAFFDLYKPKDEQESFRMRE